MTPVYIIIIIIIIIIIRNLYSAIMPLGGYRGPGPLLSNGSVSYTHLTLPTIYSV